MINGIAASRTYFGSVTVNDSQSIENKKQTSFAELLSNSGRDSGAQLDTISTGDSGLLAEPLLLPTANNVRLLSADLSRELGSFFREEGFETEPPVEFDIDVNTGQVSVKGDHPDADRIEEAVNGNEELKKKMKTLQAIASHVHCMEDSLAFQREYRASSDPAGVVAKYAYLFSGNRRSAVVSIVFDGGNAGLILIIRQ